MLILPLDGGLKNEYEGEKVDFVFVRFPDKSEKFYGYETTIGDHHYYKERQQVPQEWLEVMLG